uniref:Uncharacterized protein n=1 Tax=Anguilla anguilla TaxID=7936 RepID=A0A0E9WWJ8_ANGAN
MVVETSLGQMDACQRPTLVQHRFHIPHRKSTRPAKPKKEKKKKNTRYGKFSLLLRTEPVRRLSCLSHSKELLCEQCRDHPARVVSPQLV